MPAISLQPFVQARGSPRLVARACKLCGENLSILPSRYQNPRAINTALHSWTRSSRYACSAAHPDAGGVDPPFNDPVSSNQPGDSSFIPEIEKPKISSLEASLASFCQTTTRLFPLWVVLAAVLGYYNPPLFTWFDNNCITYGLMFVMAGMGLTLTFEEIFSVFTKTPQLLILGMVLQYSVLPFIGFLISRFWGLSSSLAVGVALVSCMPGGTASNIVAYIAKAEMPLSIMMTTASTFMAIFTTPILTSILVGTLVPIDPRAMFISVLQLVLAPVLAGAGVNQYFPSAVKRVRPFTPFLATLVVVFIVGSMIGSNVAVVGTSGLQIISAVFVLHGSGFFLGYNLSKAMGLSDKIARTNSIEVGMQSSALAAVLAKIHFTDPVVVAPCVLSACTHATMGSLLAGYWAATTKDE